MAPLVKVFFAALSTVITRLAEASITDCSNGASVFKFTELALNPATPVRGAALDMIVKFNNPGPEVSDGTVTTSVSVNYIPYPSSTEALCTNTQCPLVTGANDRSTSSVWPDTVSGKVSSKIVWTGTDGKQLLCIQINANVAAEANETTPGLRGSVIVNYTMDEIYDVMDAFKNPVEHKYGSSTEYPDWMIDEDNDVLMPYYGPEDKFTNPQNEMCYEEDRPKDLVVWNNSSVLIFNRSL